VRLVHHDPGEVREQVAPLPVVRQHAHVQHVRVRQDQVRALTDRAALLARGVAVVDRVAQVLPANAREPTRLVLRERLGGVEVEGARSDVARQRVEHGQVEGERLAAGGARGHDRVSAAGGRERVGLVRPERLDAGGGEPVEQGGMEIVRDRLRESGLLALARARHELLVAPRLEHGFPGVGGRSTAHGLR
jgi:hypothetical protein